MWVRGNFLGLQDITSGYSAASRAIVEYNESNYARLRIVLSGSVATRSGTASYLASPGPPGITSPCQALACEYSDNSRVLFLRVGAEALISKLTALTGLFPKRKMEFDPTQFTSRQLISGLKGMVESLVRQVNDETVLISPVALKEMEQAIMVQFLLACRHNFSPLLEQDGDKSVPIHVRRAAEFIEPVGISRLQ